MEIRFSASDAPPWLSGIVFSFDGENVSIQIVNDERVEKALFVIERTDFCNAIRALGISTRPVE